MVYEDAFSGVYQELGAQLGMSAGAIFILIAIISIWSIVWKGFALWKASKKNHLIWFIALLVLNTVGILEILYIYVFSKLNLSKPKAAEKKSRR